MKEEGLKKLLFKAASSQLDHRSPSETHELMHTLGSLLLVTNPMEQHQDHQSVQVDDSMQLVLEAQKEASLVALAIANTCDIHSTRALKRCVKLFANVLVNRLLILQDSDSTVESFALALCKLLSKASTVSYPHLLKFTVNILKIKPNLVDIIITEFLKVSNDKNKNINITVESTLVGMSILSALNCSGNQDIMNNFLSIASQFPAKNTLMLANTYLSKLSMEDTCTIFNFCAMKLKAQPESCLETVLVIVECLSKKRSNNADDTDSNTFIDILKEKVLPPCMKLLSSGKSTVRSTCGELLAQLTLFATCTSDSQYNMTTLDIVVDALTACLVKSTSGSIGTSSIVPLTSADHRKTVYLAISSIAHAIKDDSSQINSVDASITSKILDAVVTSLSKESSQETKEAGTNAMISWMTVHKLHDENGFTSGYNKALDYCAKPLVDKAPGVGSEFRARLGAVFTLCETSNVADSIVLDIIEKHEQSAKLFLESIIDAASKKFANSKLVPQIDGLLAVLMLLLMCQGSLQKLSKVASKILQSGKKSRDKTSFLFTASMTEACATDMIVKRLLHRSIALYSEIVGTSRDSLSSEHCYIVCMKESAEYSAAAYAMACTIAHPSSSSFTDTNSEQASLQSVITHAGPSDRSADAIVSALFYRVNEISLQREEKATTLLHSRDYREADDYSLPFHKTNGNSVRTSSLLLVKSVTDAKHFALVLILSHFATTMRAEGRKQRIALESLATDYYFTSFREHMNLSEVADLLCELSTSHATKGDPEVPISECIFQSALSTVTTLGKLAGNYDEETFDSQDESCKPFFVSWNLCITYLAPLLAKSLSDVMLKIERFSQDDIAIYNAIPGKLYTPQDPSGANNGVAKKNRMTDDEEWEMQVKRELEDKMRKDNNVLEKDEENRLAEQELRRGHIQNILDRDLSRSLCAIQTLCLSDFEIGNNILPITAFAVTSAAISKSDAMKMKLFECESVLRTLAACVYELDDSITGEIVQALIICQKKTIGEQKEMIHCVPLPHDCSCAVAVINSIDEYGESLSVNSFGFVFPIIRAALMGPRTTIGSEPALKILDRHTMLLAMNQSLSFLRKDMSSTVLELLSHDRSISFKDPMPNDVLVHIYTRGEKISASELSPLLGEDGALGGKSSRLAAMTTLGAVLQKSTKFIQTNPLIENRVLINCFASDQKINSEARRAWSIGFGRDPDIKDLHAPSKIFAVALLPLLSHNDSDIAVAAAKAFAFAIEQYPDLTHKSLNRIFNLYIDSYATIPQKNINKTDKVSDTSLGFEDSEKPVPKLVKKKATKLDIGSVKKSTAPKKKATSAISMLTKAPATKKKNSKATSALASFAPKKKERTLDQDELISQFAVLNVDDKKNEEVDNEDKVAIRKGVIRTIASLSPNVVFDIQMLKLLAGFLIAFGLADVDQTIRDSARNALSDLVASDSAKDAIGSLIPLLEVTLKTGQADKSCLGDLPTDKVVDDTDAIYNRKEGVVVALGAAAVHLRDVEDNNKISETFDMLIKALPTPSESVQSSIALCLANLMKKGKLRDDTESLLTDQIRECLHGKSLASRRGAAYGISAIIKGSGIASLKKFSVIKELEDALINGSSSSKEGALFAVELLSDRLGLLFEPYVIVLLPALLKCFSDSSDHVRAAAKSSIGLIMSKLSGHGVKLLVPAVLAGLDDDDWRTKQASIHMLGSMSHCAPKQLATCLPNIVPKLTDAFSDTHPKVKASAKTSLEDICKVIKNPEISEISSTLLQALTDPSTKTVVALESLIETEFVHAIDAASLSLIVPVIHRGLRDRAATTKRYGALIAGNICTMVDDPKDFVPYLPILLPDLKAVLLDPIPDCRSISAKALGSLTRSLGEATFPELRSWLIGVLKGDNGTSVERSGAAQGLTELLCAGGTQVVESVMRNEILPLMSHPKSGTREGVLWVLTFLPTSLGHSFAPLIDVSFPALINGLSDENESVRDVAMRAGRVTIRSHGKSQFDKVLPSLEDGLSHIDYRIRAASLNLLGDLLATLGGTKMVGGIDTQDDIRQAERAQAQIALILGPDIRKRILSRLYLRRSDTAAVVRSSAVQVWKSVVSVTPRTLKEILDVLVGQIVTALASGHPDHTQVAGRCLGEIVSKLGDTVLPEIMPVLRDALYKGDLHTRVGACVGLAEVIEGSTKEQIIKYLHVLVKVVQDALCDNEEDVRKIATSCFQNLYSAVGTKAFDEIVPSLLVEMESTSGNDNSRTRAVNGVTGILSIRSKELLPYLIPRLLRRPVTKNQASALGSICTVTGSSIFSYFSTIVPTFLDELSLTFDQEVDETTKATVEAIRQSIRSLCGSVDEAGIYPLICEIASKCSSDKVGIRRECCWMLQVIIEERKDKADYYEHIDIMLRELIHRLNDENEFVLKSTVSALGALSTYVPAEELVKSIEFIRNLIASMVSDARRRKGGVGDGEFLLPGFNMPKGLEPMLPIYSRGILYGNSTIREVSAAGLGELISITSPKYLAGPFIIKITGPLLRIVGDRNPSAVKISIIKTLGLILSKGGVALRAFVPQFQTTFCKALSDPSRQVRVEAIKALALLMPLTTRIDPLIKELVSTCLAQSDTATSDSGSVVAVQTATLEALAVVLKFGGKQIKLSESVPSALQTGKSLLFHVDDGIREAAAKTIAAACELSDETIVKDLVFDLANVQCESFEEKHGFANYCRYIICSQARSALSISDMDKMRAVIEKMMVDRDVSVREAACIAAGALLGGVEATHTDTYLKNLSKTVLLCMDVKESMDILKSIAKGLCVGATLNADLFTNKLSLPILDAALKNSMMGQQRVQLAFNDFLWLALDVKNGEEGLDRYCSWSMFENAKQMKSLFSKVLTRIKDVDLEKVY